MHYLPTVWRGLSSGWLTVVLVGVLTTAHSLRADDGSAPRAKPPVWPEDVKAIFFDDARKVLVGPRPDYAAAAKSRATTDAGAADAEPTATDSGYAWSRLIDAETIETEIKRVATRLPALVANPSTFKGGGYRECRQQFTWLAVLFAVAADFDLDIRWQDSARGLSQFFGRAGFNCKVGTDQSWREAQLRAQDLADLVRGGRPRVPPPREDADFAQVADRAPLMERMEQLLDEQMSPNASDARALRKNNEQLHHDSQLMAALAEVITRPGFDYHDDESYLTHAHALRDGAARLTQATGQQDHAAARAALGEMSRACSNCHDEFR